MSAVLPEKLEFTRMDRLVNSILRVSETKSQWSGLSLAYLVGWVTNASWSTDTNILLLFVSGPLNWLACGMLLFFSVGRIVLRRYVARQSYAIRLAELYNAQVSGFLGPFQRGRIGWRSCLTMVKNPHLHEGWKRSKVFVEYEAGEYELPSQYVAAHTEYSTRQPQEKDNRTRLMMTATPGSFTDAPSLVISVKETDWRTVQFFHKQYWRNNPHEQQGAIGRALQGGIDFANSLCLHLVVSTSDDYVLLTQSSPNVSYYPGAWACSIGEQLDLQDLRRPDDDCIANWVGRALREELGVPDGHHDSDRVRIMALILEGEIVNFAIVGIAPLAMDKANLEAFIDKSSAKMDGEIADWTFMRWSDLLRELLQPTLEYHPSPYLRMFYGCLHRFGAAGLDKRLMEMRFRRTKAGGREPYAGQ